MDSNCFTDSVARRRCEVIDATGSVILINSSSFGVPAYYPEQDKRCLPGTTSVVGNSLEDEKNDPRDNCCGGAVCVLDGGQLLVYGVSWWAHNFMYPPVEEYKNYVNDPTSLEPYWGGALFTSYSIYCLFLW